MTRVLPPLLVILAATGAGGAPAETDFPRREPRTSLDALAKTALKEEALKVFLEKPSGNDEFEQNEHRKRLDARKKEMKDRVFIVRTEARLGTYDFTRKAYPLKVSFDEAAAVTDGFCKTKKREEYRTERLERVPRGRNGFEKRHSGLTRAPAKS